MDPQNTPIQNLREEDVHAFIKLILRTGWGMAFHAETMEREIKAALRTEKNEAIRLFAEATARTHGPSEL